MGLAQDCKLFMRVGGNLGGEMSLQEINSQTTVQRAFLVQKFFFKYCPIPASFGFYRCNSKFNPNYNIHLDNQIGHFRLFLLSLLRELIQQWEGVQGRFAPLLLDFDKVE